MNSTGEFRSTGSQVLSLKLSQVSRRNKLRRIICLPIEYGVCCSAAQCINFQGSYAKIA
jgi:hypothetical protein